MAKPHMGLFQMKFKSIELAALAVIIFVLSGITGLGAEKTDDPGILFLTFHTDGKSVTLKESATVPGTLKQPRQSPGLNDLEYKALSSDLSVLFQGYINNPLVKRIEYADNQGQLKTKIIELPESDFTLRIIDHQDMKHIDFYRVVDRSNTQSEKISREFIGRLTPDIVREPKR
jgi:hypothetical protein